jgi:hypothetical protein
VASGITCSVTAATSTTGSLTISATSAAALGTYTATLTVSDSTTAALLESQAVGFTVIAQPTTVTDANNGTVTANFTLPASFNAPAASTLSCSQTVATQNSSGAYVKSSSTLAQFGLSCSAITLGTNGAYSFTVTAGTATAQVQVRDKRIYAALYGSPLLLLFGLLPAVRRHRKALLRGLILLALTAGLINGATGCSSGGFNPNYQVNPAVSGYYLLEIVDSNSITTPNGTVTSGTAVAEVPIFISY